MINTSEDIVRSNNLRLTAITCLTEADLATLASDDIDCDQSDDNEREWVATSDESRSAFRRF